MRYLIFLLAFVIGLQAQSMPHPEQIVNPNQVRINNFGVQGGTNVRAYYQIRQDWRIPNYWPYLCFTDWIGIELPGSYYRVYRSPMCFTEYGQCIHDGGTDATCQGKSQAGPGAINPIR